ncbi:MAG: YicC family protein [Pantoea sp. Brub]|nr:YicC family protein [Pantoea sp. Brub]
MIRSMTAYTYHEIKKKWGSIIWEIRSINQRFLEININLPKQWRILEPSIQKRIRKCVIRGKIECNLYVNNIIQNNTFIINKILIQKLIKAANWIKLQNNEGIIDPLKILNWPGVLNTQNKNINNINLILMRTIDQSLNDLILNRENEGKSLKKLIEIRLYKIIKTINKIKIYIPEELKYQRERLLLKLQEASIQIDKNRFEQELIMMVHKTDIEEELDRLYIHVQEVLNILDKTEPVGRRLDFLMQELNRESNTITSKSININITTCAIELKVLIEQIREQIQNIE